MFQIKFLIIYKTKSNDASSVTMNNKCYTTKTIAIVEVIITKLVHTKKGTQTTERVSHDLVYSLKLWTK